MWNAKELNDKYDNLCGKLEDLTSALHTFPRTDQQHSPQMREWEPFLLIDGGVTDGSGNATVGTTASLVCAANGWEAYVHRVSVTVQGASSTATVSNYIGGVSDQRLFDYANNMLGNSPSKLVGGYTHGVYVQQTQHVTVVITGAAATSGVVVRVEGRRRQL